MQVIFNSIDVKGFLSIGESKIELNNQGTVYVVGRNESPGTPSSNGAGKSSIFEAILYTLTGTTLRGTTDVINMYWKGFCEVTLDLTVDGVNYTIMRTRSHPVHGNNLKLTKDGIDISGDKLRKSEQILETELGQLTSSLISSVIILGQGLPNKFTDLKPAARKERLEELSQTSDFINELKTRLTLFSKRHTITMNESKIEEGKLTTTISIAEDTLKRKGAELVRLTEQLNGTNSLSEDEVEKLQKTVDNHNQELNQLNETVGIIQQKLSQVSSMISTNEMTIRTRNAESSRYTSEMNRLATSSCPTCGQYIQSPTKVSELRNNYANKLNAINDEISKLRENNNSLSLMQQNLSNNIAETSKKQTKLSSEIIELHSKLSEAKSKIESITIQINSINDELSRSRNELEIARLELGGVRDRINQENTYIGILDYLTKKSSKEFRGYLLSGIVNYLNSKVKAYGQQLFGTESLALILEDNKIYIEYDNRPYENLSGGEKQRADLAMQFSLRDMLMNNLGFTCNMLVIDEGFDNLDEAGVNALVGLINSKSNIDSVFTISHHTLSIPFDKTLCVTKDLTKVSTVSELI